MLNCVDMLQEVIKKSEKRMVVRLLCPMIAVLAWIYFWFYLIFGHLGLHIGFSSESCEIIQRLMDRRKNHGAPSKLGRTNRMVRQVKRDSNLRNERSSY